MAAVWDRIDSELTRRSMSWAELGRVIGATDQVMHNWKGRGVPAARHKAIADALGWTVDRLLSDHWTLDQHPSEGHPPSGVAQELSNPKPDDEPPQHTWEFILSAAALPPRFRLAVPDDALAPTTPRGTVLIFEPGAAPVFGHGVLVEDAAGHRYIRKYTQGLGGGWRASANNPAYLTLDSASGARVLAVVIARETGEV
jgi:hypothetical protein